ncbi:putative ribonuclease H-like domain-containing protein, partial [Tanacetum coccineum]
MVCTLSNFLLKNGYRRGTIDKTLFLKKDKHDIILVQVYVDDIIFGSTKKSWCDEFEALMKSRFQMSSMGELTFFLGLQNAVHNLLTQKPLVKDEEASDVDVHLYRSMIGSLMYVTASRPDIMFAVCACSRFQVTPKTSHLSAVKRIFRYLKGKPSLGLWYPRESSFDLESYSDSDYAGANLDRKSTTGGCQFLGRRLITWQCKKQTIVATSTTEAEYVAAASCCGQDFHPSASIPDSSQKPTGENIGFADQPKKSPLLKAKITKLKKQAKPVIKHFKAYLKSVSLQHRHLRKSFSKKNRVHKESVSKQGRKIAKGESSFQRDPLFDEMPEDKIDHMETENAQSEGRTKEMVDEEKEIDEVRLSTDDEVSTVKEGVSTDFEKVSADRPIVSTNGSKVGTDEQVEGTEEIFKSTEEQKEGSEEKVESTAGQRI